MDVVPSAQFPGLNNITFAKLVSSGISGFLVITAVILIFVLLLGGVSVITSGGGDPQKAARGQQAVTGAMIGLAVVFGAWAIITLVNKFFQVNLFEMQIPGLWNSY